MFVLSSSQCSRRFRARAIVRQPLTGTQRRYKRIPHEQTDSFGRNNFVRDVPDELGTIVKFGTILPLPVVPEELHWRPAVAVTACYTGPVEEGERVLGPLREHGTPLCDLVAPKPYMAHQSGLDTTVPRGWHYYWKSMDLPELSDD